MGIDQMDQSMNIIMYPLPNCTPKIPTFQGGINWTNCVYRAKWWQFIPELVVTERLMTKIPQEWCLWFNMILFLFFDLVDCFFFLFEFSTKFLQLCLIRINSSKHHWIWNPLLSLTNLLIVYVLVIHCVQIVLFNPELPIL
jgi:hypothetical protein